MSRYVPLFLTFVILGRTCAGPARGFRSTTEEHYGIHPIFGPLRPSQDIKDFVASVFRKNDDYDDEQLSNTTKAAGATTLDSNEQFRPHNDSSRNAHMGFESYWPGSEWIARKMEVDRCNTSDAECSTMYKEYGPVCAGSSNLNAHHTFQNMCEMEDANCRDGTLSYISNSSNPDDMRWWPVPRNGRLHLKIAASSMTFFVFARMMGGEPKFYFSYAWKQWTETISQYQNYYNTMHNLQCLGWRTFSENLVTNKVKNFDITMNETEGTIRWDEIHQDNRRGVSYTFPDYQFRETYKFPIRYLGIFGGNKGSESWIEITGLPRGYLAAYRGECREPLPTLATAPPKNIGGRHKIQVFNFAERMDQFGYNFSRVTGSTVNDYGYDGYGLYPALP